MAGVPGKRANYLMQANLQTIENTDLAPKQVAKMPKHFSIGKSSRI